MSSSYSFASLITKKRSYQKFRIVKNEEIGPKVSPVKFYMLTAKRENVC